MKSPSGVKALAGLQNSFKTADGEVLTAPAWYFEAKTDEDKAIVTAARMGACRYVTNKVRGRDDGTTYEQLMADDHAGLAPLLSWIKVAYPAGCIDIRCAPDKEKEARDDRKPSA
jgi:hypothetical protein